jgi:uncharacterized membrane protein
MAAAHSTLPHLPHDPITCPVCGGANPPEAVFCGNPQCGKALGDFKFVLEELREETKWYETLAGKVARFIGQPAFLIVHAFWFLVWILANSGYLTGAIFDEYPFELLGILLGIEAVFITGFLLIDDSREDAHANKLARLDYEVNVRTYRKLQEIDIKLQWIIERMARDEDGLRDA